MSMTPDEKTIERLLGEAAADPAPPEVVAAAKAAFSVRRHAHQLKGSCSRA
ncbi:MAG: hypothetical protein ACKVWR_20945 [Acidimicrobiales bacterium]